MSTKYAYECSNDHSIWNSPRPVKRCPVTPYGQPCTGTLRQVGGPKPEPKAKAKPKP